MDSNHQQDLIAQFSAITGASPSVAQGALHATNWNIEQSVALFYDQEANAPEGDADEGVADADTAGSSRPSQPTSAQPAAASSSSNRNQGARGTAGSRPKQMTFQDLQRGGGGDDDDEDDDPDDKNPDLFAGGEKSGLAVQDPSQQGGANHFRNIINQARQNRERPAAMDEEEDSPSGRPSNFGGRAQTLGGDDAPSRVVQDPSAAAAGPSSRRRMPRVSRTLHLWEDGVSVDDGPLFRFDDPANANLLQEINNGRAPKSLLDVEPDQEVDLNLDPHKGEKYVAPKKVFKPFGGQGQRLGSPVPGVESSSSSAAAPAAAAPAQAALTSSSNAPSMPIDSSAPTVQMQIRLGDGTRLASRFNTTHTIGDIYEFVDRAANASSQRAYVLQTTFPSTELTDKGKVLGEMGEFKRGGVVVQKWK